MRPRREVGHMTLTVLRPVLRYSYGRAAWVLRVGGKKFGPVLKVRGGESSADRAARPS